MRASACRVIAARATRWAIALGLSALLIGCIDAPSSPPAQVATISPSKAVVYVYRLRPLGLDPLGSVSVDCGYPVTLSDDEYTQYFAAPGELTCSMRREGFLKYLPVSGEAATPVKLSVLPGKVYYVRAVMAGNLTAVTESFTPIDPMIAQAEIRHCNLR